MSDTMIKISDMIKDNYKSIVVREYKDNIGHIHPLKRDKMIENLKNSDDVLPSSVLQIYGEDTDILNSFKRSKKFLFADFTPRSKEVYELNKKFNLSDEKYSLAIFNSAKLTESMFLDLLRITNTENVYLIVSKKAFTLNFPFSIIGSVDDVTVLYIQGVGEQARENYASHILGENIQGWTSDERCLKDFSSLEELITSYNNERLSFEEVLASVSSAVGNNKDVLKYFLEDRSLHGFYLDWLDNLNNDYKQSFNEYIQKNYPFFIRNNYDGFAGTMLLCPFKLFTEYDDICISKGFLKFFLKGCTDNVNSLKEKAFERIVDNLYNNSIKGRPYRNSFKNDPRTLVGDLEKEVIEIKGNYFNKSNALMICFLYYLFRGRLADFSFMFDSRIYNQNECTFASVDGELIFSLHKDSYSNNKIMKFSKEFLIWLNVKYGKVVGWLKREEDVINEFTEDGAIAVDFFNQEFKDLEFTFE